MAAPSSIRERDNIVWHFSPGEVSTPFILDDRALEQIDRLRGPQTRQEFTCRLIETGLSLVTAASRPDVGRDRKISLSLREREVLYWSARGMSKPDIATRLSISTHTVQSHAHGALRKLKAKNIAHGVFLAVSLRLLAPAD